MEIGIFLTKHKSDDTKIASCFLTNDNLDFKAFNEDGKLFVEYLKANGLEVFSTKKVVMPSEVQDFVKYLPIVLKNGYIYAKKI